MNRIIIIGTGLAGYTLAREFRKLDPVTPLTLITTDDGRFYSKPMLSNALASGRVPASLATSDAAQMAEQLNATILSHSKVTSIDVAEQTVSVNGAKLSYEKLALALGADPLKSALAGDAVDNVISVNDLQDYTRFHAAIQGTKRVAIMGAGLIGCEFANDLSSAGFAVDVIHPGPQPMCKLLPKAAGTALQQALEAIGVTWHFGKKVEAVDHASPGYRISLSDGRCIEADAVLSAIGLRPRTSLAQAAGIEVQRGITVDRNLLSSAANVYALGDCAEVEGLVLPFILPIMQQARALAKTLTGATTPVSYPAMPIVIKTPACPVVISTSPLHSDYEWEMSSNEEGVRAVYYDTGKKLQGFALTGKATSEKASLLRGLAAWL